MDKLSNETKNFIRLIQRSANSGDGWRQVSSIVWPYAIKMSKITPELLELNEVERLIRLSPEGETVARYL